MPTETDARPYDATRDVIEAAPAVIKESKSGAKTTEFWLAVVTSVLVVLNGIPLPEQYEGVVVAALAGIYALSRGISKQGIPAVEVEKANKVEVK